MEAGGSIAVGVAALVRIAVWALVIQPEIDCRTKELNRRSIFPLTTTCRLAYGLICSGYSHFTLRTMQQSRFV